MTVKELIERLSAASPDAEVFREDRDSTRTVNKVEIRLGKDYQLVIIY